jgi:hypothetical protein
MIVQPSQRAQVVTSLATALRNAGLATRVIADESNTVCEFLKIVALIHHTANNRNWTSLLQLGSVSMAVFLCRIVAGWRSSSPVQL